MTPRYSELHDAFQALGRERELDRLSVALKDVDAAVDSREFLPVVESDHVRIRRGYALLLQEALLAARELVR